MVSLAALIAGSACVLNPQPEPPSGEASQNGSGGTGGEQPGGSGGLDGGNTAFNDAELSDDGGDARDGSDADGEAGDGEAGDAADGGSDAEDAMSDAAVDAPEAD